VKIMKTRMLQNSLLLKNLAKLKTESANRRLARMQSSEMPEQLKIIQLSQNARKTTVRLRDELLLGPEEQAGTIKSQLKVLNKVLETPLPQNQRELIKAEVTKWQEQLARVQKRVDATKQQ
jgi:hypothetical protein